MLSTGGWESRRSTALFEQSLEPGVAHSASAAATLDLGEDQTCAALARPMQPLSGLLQPRQAVSASFEVVERPFHDVVTDNVRQVDESSSQRGTGDAVDDDDVATIKWSRDAVDDHPVDSHSSASANSDFDRRVCDSVNPMQVCPGTKRDGRARRTGANGNQHPLLEGVNRAVDDQRSSANLAQCAGCLVSADRSWTEVGFGGLASRKDGVVRGCDVTSAVHRDERGHVARLRKSPSHSTKWCQKVRRNELSGTTSLPDARRAAAQPGWALVTRVFISRTACCQPTKMA